MCLVAANPSDLGSFAFAGYYSVRRKARVESSISNSSDSKAILVHMVWFWKALLNGVQSEWSKQDDRFPAAHEIPAAHQTASKAASFESFRSPSAWLLARKFRWLVRDEGKIYLLLSCRVWKPGDAIFWTKIALESEPFEIQLYTLVFLLTL